MLYKLLKFIGALFLIIGALYSVHWWVLNSFFPVQKYIDFLHFSYLFNVGTTLLFTTTLILGSKKVKEQTGFIFLIEGMLKIGLFLYFIKIFGFEIEKSNFLVFFVPYIACLIVELFFVLQILKDIDVNNGG